jgi:hypothetical protein
VLDVTEQIRRYADGVAESIETAPFRITDPVETRPGPGRRPAWPWLVAAALALVLLAGGIWVAFDSSGSDPRPAGPVDGPTGVELLDPGPLEPRADAPLVWTGNEAVVWGGDLESNRTGQPDRPFADGAAYDPVTRRWRMMSPSPLPNSMDGVSAVATDQGVVIARGSKVALWSPDTDTWRTFDDAPRPGPYGAPPDLISTGREVISVRANAVLSLVSGQWTPLPEPPIELQSAQAVWTGDELVVLGERVLTEPGGLVLRDPRSPRWTEIAVPERFRGNALSAAWDGERILVADYEMRVGTYTPSSGTWDELSTIPGRFSEGGPTISTAGATVVVTTPYAIVLRVGDGPWVPVPYGKLDFWHRALVIPDGSLLVFDMNDDGEMKLARVDPERLATSPRALQAGVATVTLPPGIELRSSSSDGAKTGPADAASVHLQLSTTSGPCSVTGVQRPDSSAHIEDMPFVDELRRLNREHYERYQNQVNRLAQRRQALTERNPVPVRELDAVNQELYELTQRGPDRPGFSLDHRVWFAFTYDDGDLVRLECDDPLTTEELANGTTLPDP